MKPTPTPTNPSPRLPVAWRQAEFAARKLNAEDTCDDRVSEDIFDSEDEREEISILLHKSGYDGTE